MDAREHLRTLREVEARAALRLFPDPPAGARVLEIGAGSGWQSQLFTQLGYKVSAIDVETSHYLESAVFPVKVYDGHRIPFADASFDVVFSSNVLEHIPHVEAFQEEIRRVLAPGGYAVHVLPSASWRFWTNLTHFVALPRKALDRLRRARAARGDLGDPFWEAVEEEASIESMDLVDFAEFVASDEDDAGPSPEFESALRKRLRQLQKLQPARHGEVGNSLTEIYWFSSQRWKKLFAAEGFRVRECLPTRLFYTGYSAFGPRLPIRARHLASRWLGSSCMIYVVEPADR